MDIDASPDSIAKRSAQQTQPRMTTLQIRQLACLASAGAIAVVGSLLSCHSPQRATAMPSVESDVARLTVLLVAQESGAPLAGVAVEFEVQRIQAEDIDRALQVKLLPEHASRTTDERGQAHFEVRTQREYSLHGSLRDPPFGDFYRTVGPFELGKHEELRIAIPVQSNRVVRGRVISIADHAPIADAQLRVFADLSARPGFDTPLERHFGDSVKTDANGQYVLRVSSSFATRLSILAAGHAPAQTLILPPRDERLRYLSWPEPMSDTPAPELQLDVSLRPARTTELRVVDNAGRPQSGVDVCVTSHENRAFFPFDPALPPVVEDDMAFHGRTDAAGNCPLPAHLSSGMIGIELSLGGHRLHREWAGPNFGTQSASNLSFVVAPLSRVSGRAITPQGASAAHQELWLVDPRGCQGDRFDNPNRPVASTITGADGSFAFEKVCEGEWLIGPPYRRIDAVCFDAHAAAPIGTRVKVTAGGTNDAVRVPIWRELYVAGRVLDEQDRPVAMASLSLRRKPGELAQGELSWSDGTFVFGPLAAGEYELNAGDNVDWTSSDPLRVQAGMRELVIRVTRGARLRLRVNDADGVAHTDVQVELKPHAQSISIEDSLWAVRWNESRYEVPSLRAGRYDLLVRRRQGNDTTLAACSVQLARGETRDLTVVLAPAATLELRNQSSARIRIEYSVDDGMIESVELPPGAWVGPQLPGGSVAVRVCDSAGQELLRRTLRLETAATTRFEFP